MTLVKTDLSAIEQAILGTIEQMKKNNPTSDGVSITFAQIGLNTFYEQFKDVGYSTVYYYVKRLERFGFIELNRNKQPYIITLLESEE